MPGVTPKQIYDTLTGAGFSTAQAIGIMANMIAESSLNPESRIVDSNGRFSNGLVQFNEATYPDSGKLVTGNPVADMKAQVAYLRQHVSGQAISGADGFTVAGNFAQFFEVCKNCNHGNTGPGGWQVRVDNSVKIINWITTGNWPTTASPGGGAPGGTPPPSAGGSTGGDTATANPIQFKSDTVPGLEWAGSFITGLAEGFGAGTGAPVNQAGGLLGIGTSVAGLATTLSKMAQLFLLLFRPQLWLRFGAAILGFIALGGAAYFMKESLS